MSLCEFSFNCRRMCVTSRQRRLHALSQKLTDAQTPRRSIKRDALLLWIVSFKKWNAIVFGANIVVYSDHNPPAYVWLSTAFDALVTSFIAIFDWNSLQARQNAADDCMSRLNRQWQVWSCMQQTCRRHNTIPYKKFVTSFRRIGGAGSRCWQIWKMSVTSKGCSKIKCF